MTNDSTNVSPPGSSATRAILATFGRGLIYALCMCFVYTFVFRPALTSSTASTAEKSGDEQMRTYNEQVARTNAMYAESEMQQRRMKELLTKQEELVKRQEAVISAWERQAGLRN